MLRLMPPHPQAGRSFVSGSQISNPAKVYWFQIPDAQAVLDYQEILELPQLTGVIYLASVIKDVSILSFYHLT